MNIDISENAAIVALLQRRGRQEKLLTSPDEATCDPYNSMGSHPEIVERVWDELGKSISRASIQIVCGCPVLVHPESGIIFAVCYGTSYFLRFSLKIACDAKRLGFKEIHSWNDGPTTNLCQILGPEWVFGEWERELELKWLQLSYAPFPD